MIGFSTCWNSEKVSSGSKMLSQIKDMGFDALELEYRISSAIYKEILPEIKGGRFQVLSLHNFFPAPELAGLDDFGLCSPDPDLKRVALRFTLRTIEIAHELEAKVAILHLGYVKMDHPGKVLKELFDKGKVNLPEGETLIKSYRRIREERKEKLLDALLFNLEGLNKRAEELNVFLGVENRYGFHEIPDIDEIDLILNKFEGGNIRYWHDVGHAGVNGNLGYGNQEEFLKRYSDQMVGIHLHDIKGYDDHLVPGTGDIDFELIAKYVKEDTIKILEVHSKVSEEEIRQGLERLKMRGIT